MCTSFMDGPLARRASVAMLRHSVSLSAMSAPPSASVLPKVSRPAFAFVHFKGCCAKGCLAQKSVFPSRDVSDPTYPPRGKGRKSEKFGIPSQMRICEMHSTALVRFILNPSSSPLSLSSLGPTIHSRKGPFPYQRGAVNENGIWPDWNNGFSCAHGTERYLVQ